MLLRCSGGAPERPLRGEALGKFRRADALDMLQMGLLGKALGGTMRSSSGSHERHSSSAMKASALKGPREAIEKL
eukprot:7987624-Pyramimonas_sp.AAC.1